MIYNYLQVNDDYVSREHISIRYNSDNRNFLIQERDRGTKNGTYVNGEVLTPNQSLILHDGDLIQLAKVANSYRVIFKFRESDETVADHLGVEQITESAAMRIDSNARKVFINEAEVHLRKKEFDLLEFLYNNKGKACNKNEIAQEVWNQEGGFVSQETIEQNISRIRKALKVVSKQNLYITTIHGGYRLDL